MGRPKLYGSAAERRRAFLMDKDRFDLVVPKHIGDTVRELAAEFDASTNDVLIDLVRYALTNRNWKHSGLLWSTAHDSKKPD